MIFWQSWRFTNFEASEEAGKIDGNTIEVVQKEHQVKSV